MKVLFPSLFIIMFFNDRDKDVACWPHVKSPLKTQGSSSTDEIMHHKNWEYYNLYSGGPVRFSTVPLVKYYSHRYFRES